MSTSDTLKNVKWRKISALTTWRPKDGEELFGYYVGRTKRDGSFGPYEVVLVAVPYKGTFMISGTRLIQLMDSGALVRGDAVRIRYHRQGAARRRAQDEAVRSVRRRT